MKKPYTLVNIYLMKGVLYNSSAEVWELLIRYEPDVKSYFSDANLDVYIDKVEGHAYLKPFEDETMDDLPKIIEKRQLSFLVSLLCLLLRKHLIEHDSQGDQVRAIISEEELITLMKPFLKETTNEVNQIRQIRASIKKVLQEGFLRPMQNDGDHYEINRIIKGFINADIVQQTLEKYKNHSNENPDNDGSGTGI